MKPSLVTSDFLHHRVLYLAPSLDFVLWQDFIKGFKRQLTSIIFHLDFERTKLVQLRKKALGTGISQVTPGRELQIFTSLSVPPRLILHSLPISTEYIQWSPR